MGMQYLEQFMHGQDKLNQSTAWYVASANQTTGYITSNLGCDSPAKREINQKLLCCGKGCASSRTRHLMGWSLVWGGSIVYSFKQKTSCCLKQNPMHRLENNYHLPKDFFFLLTFLCLTIIGCCSGDFYVCLTTKRYCNSNWRQNHTSAFSKELQTYTKRTTSRELTNENV